MEIANILQIAKTVKNLNQLSEVSGVPYTTLRRKLAKSGVTIVFANGENESGEVVKPVVNVAEVNNHTKVGEKTPKLDNVVSVSESGEKPQKATKGSKNPQKPKISHDDVLRIAIFVVLLIVQLVYFQSHIYNFFVIMGVSHTVSLIMGFTIPVIELVAFFAAYRIRSAMQQLDEIGENVGEMLQDSKKILVDKLANMNKLFWLVFAIDVVCHFVSVFIHIEVKPNGTAYLLGHAADYSNVVYAGTSVWQLKMLLSSFLTVVMASFLLILLKVANKM